MRGLSCDISVVIHSAQRAYTLKAGWVARKGIPVSAAMSLLSVPIGD